MVYVNGLEKNFKLFRLGWRINNFAVWALGLSVIGLISCSVLESKIICGFKMNGMWLTTMSPNNDLRLEMRLRDSLILLLIVTSLIS